MGKGCLLPSKCSVIVFWHIPGEAWEIITQKLKVPKGAVQSTLKIHKESNNYKSRKSTGIPCMAVKQEDNILKRTFEIID